MLLSLPVFKQANIKQNAMFTILLHGKKYWFYLVKL